MDITDSYIYFLGRFDKESNLQEVIKFYDVEGIIEMTREDFEGKYQKELNKNEARLFWKEKLSEDFKRIENDVALNFIERAEKVRIAEGKTGDYTYRMKKIIQMKQNLSTIVINTQLMTL